jgi:hypothetical protein
MNNTIISFFILAFMACNSQQHISLESREVILENLQKDSVIFFLGDSMDTLSILREVEIFHNDNLDTIMLGYGIIPPAFTGKIWFAQDNLDPSSAVYLENTKELDLNKPVSYSKLFTIGLVNQKYERGFKKVGLRLHLK